MSHKTSSSHGFGTPSSPTASSASHSSSSASGSTKGGSSGGAGAGSGAGGGGKARGAGGERGWVAAAGGATAVYAFVPVALWAAVVASSSPTNNVSCLLALLPVLVVCWAYVLQLRPGRKENLSDIGIVVSLLLTWVGASSQLKEWFPLTTKALWDFLHLQ
ncbi:hypothetical protein Pelo_8845 [Pelomyxa schiedti]|nr:hypothetical protein Pelo_8845 [Pelomyxa schiedti]